MAISIVLFVVLGSVLEGIPVIVLFGPLLFPMAHQVGIHEVHYAMVAILAMGVGLFAPPFGVGYYVACAIGRCNPDDGMRHIWRYLAALMVGLRSSPRCPGFPSASCEEHDKEDNEHAHDQTVLLERLWRSAAPLLPRYARAAEFSWKFAHTAPLAFPLHIRLAEAAEQIGKDSNGRMELQIFPDAQLGGDNDLLSQARSGAIEFCQPTGQILASILPVTAISALGFAWSDYSTRCGRRWMAISAAYVRTQIAAKAGLVAMERMWDLGFRQITTSTKPIRTADDLVGLKIRTPVAPSLVTLFKTLKAAPLSMQFTEVYSALQTHIADAQENPLTLIKVTKLYEVQKYCSLTNHVWDGHWCAATPPPGRACRMI